MKNLLKFEFRKLFQMKTLYIFSGILVAFLVFTVGTYKMMDVLMQETGIMAETGMDISMFGLSSFSGKDFLVSALYNSEITIALAVVISLLLCTDYSSGTIKNIVAKGYSRAEIFFSKFLAAITVTVIFTVICWISGFILGTAFWKNPGDGWEISIFYNLFAQLILMIVYCSMFCLLASLIKKTGGVITLSIVIPIAMDLIIQIIDLFINSENFSLGDYWFQSYITKLSNTAVSTDTITYGLIAAVLYIAVFTGLNILVTRKSEV